MENQTGKKKGSLFAGVLILTMFLGVIGLLTYTVVIRLVPLRDVGTCFGDKQKNLESWETPRRYEYLINQVGNRAYKVTYLNPRFMRGEESTIPFDTVEIVYETINCGDVK